MTKKKLSVQEMLALARQKDGGAKPPAEGAAPAPSETSTPAESSAPAETGAVAETPAAEPEPSLAETAAEAPKPAAPATPGKKLSVQEMLAAARAQKGPGSAAPKPAAPSPVEAKPAEAKKPADAKKPAEVKKPAAKAEDKAIPGGPKPSSSILGGAAKHKAGPLSKAEAAAKASPKAPEKPKKEEKVAAVAPPMPARPESLRPRAAAADPNRRGILSAILGTFLGIGFTSMSATFGLWGLGLARFMFPNVIRQPPMRFKVGFPADFPPGKVENKFKAQYGVWVVNAEYEGRLMIVALKSVCTHLGCTPNWLEGEQKFKCPCHGSGFYKDGVNFEGPAPRPLERYGIRVADDGQLEIDKSRSYNQEKGEWTNQACYVAL